MYTNFFTGKYQFRGITVKIFFEAEYYEFVEQIKTGEVKFAFKVRNPRRKNSLKV